MKLTSKVVLVTLNVPPKLEEAVVDWLLGSGRGSGFTSYPVRGHSSSAVGLSLAEQVSGRQKRIQFEIEMAASDAAEFIQNASAAFGAADVQCVVLPAFAAGSLADISAQLDDPLS